jgi:plasmid maintenance system antidote protein VapI
VSEPADTEPAPRPAFAYINAFLDQNAITKQRFADKIHRHVDHVTPILSGARLISHETARAIEKAYPQLKALGLLVQQAKWRLHQLDHPDQHPAHTRPRRPGAKRSNDIDEDEVKRLYVDRSVSMRDITAKTKASLSTIYAIIDDAGIPRRGPGRPSRRAT